MVNGKQKGNSFERNIANMLCERFAPYTGIEKPFRRNPDSGSFFGGSNIARVDMYDTNWALYGDLICPKNFRFSVECKHYKEPPTLNSVVRGEVKQWDDWLAQARQDAKVSGKQMMLIIRYNRTDIFAFLNWKIDDRKPVIEYKGAYLYLLEDLLKNHPDQFFFDEK